MFLKGMSAYRPVVHIILPQPKCNHTATSTAVGRIDALRGDRVAERLGRRVARSIMRPGHLYACLK